QGNMTRAWIRCTRRNSSPRCKTTSGSSIRSCCTWTSTAATATARRRSRSSAIASTSCGSSFRAWGCARLLGSDAGTGEAPLPPRLVDGDRDGIGQIQAAHAGAHRDAQLCVRRKLGEDRRGQSGGLAAEDKDIVGAKSAVEERSLALGRQRVPAARAQRIDRGPTGGPVTVREHARAFVVIEAGAPELAVVEPETERLDQMQLGTRVGRKPDHVARVRRYLRLNENNRYHRQGRHALRRPL